MNRKWMISIVSLSLAVTLSACGTGDPTEGNNDNVPSNQSEVAESDDSAQSEKVLLREQINRDPFGVTKAVFEYDENGHRNYEKITFADSSDYVENSWINTPSGKKLSGETNRYVAGKLYISSFEYTYDSSDRILSSKLMEDSGVVYQLQEYEYVDHNGSYRTSQRAILGDTVRELTQEVTLDIDGNRIEDKYSINGAIEMHNKYEYDSHGNEVKFTDKDGNTYTTVNTYDGDLRTKVEVYNNEEKLTRYIEYVYDDSGEMIKQSEFNDYGKLTHETEFIYGIG